MTQNKARRVHGCRWGIAVSVLSMLCGGGCAAPPEGLAATEEGDGPEIIFDLQRRPLPELPFPNDIATRPDPSSPTGKRVNASLVADTHLERVARRRFDELTGFGVYQPIQVRFDAPLDLEVIYQSHRDYRTRSDGRDYDFENDVVYVFDVTADSPTYLQPVALDFGEGNFPHLLRTPNQYWEHDPKTITKALAFETYYEDWNQNGELDPGEDIDLDGVLDFPNYDPREDGNPSTLDVNRDLLTFYERETNTLLFKPVLPLREGTRYAVVITKDLTDEDGNPVRSPFPYVNHAAQTEELRPVLDALEPFGHGEDDIAFAWTFTTQRATDGIITVRNGLYGEGPMAWLAEDFPTELGELLPMQDPEAPGGEPRDNLHILPHETLRPLIGPLAQAAFSGFGINDVSLVERNHDYYAYHISGVFRSPRLIDITAPHSKNLDERAWPADLTDPTLRERIGYHDVQFWCAIPKDQFKEDPNAPAPVVLYAHGYTSNKIEQLGLALHAKFGIAGCSIDAPNHGVVVGDQEDLVRGLFAALGIGPAADALLRGRLEDMDGDGDLDPGGEFFLGYMFKTRDNLRQALVDWMTLVRLLRSFDGEQRMLDVDGDGVDELLGDFNGDGIVDLGGDSDYFVSGTSLGGVLSSVLSAIEPAIVAGAPIAGGGGLVDLTLRSEQGGVVEAVGLRLFGPLILGEPAAGGGTRIYQLVPNGNEIARRDIAVREGIEPGQVVMVTNEHTGASRCALVMPDEPPPGYEDFEGWPEAQNCSDGDPAGCRTCPEGTEGTYACDLARTFRVGIAADHEDPLTIEVLPGRGSIEVSGDDRDCSKVGDPDTVARIESFEFAGQYRDLSWGPGDSLIAMESGYGFQRSTPSLRRFVGLAQAGIEAADPAVYAPHYAKEPFTFRENGVEFVDRPTHVLDVVTIGDPNVPVNTGLAIAKGAGVIDFERPDRRFGKTPNRVLIEEGVQAGIPWLEIRGEQWGPVLVDVDNLSESSNTTPMDLAGSADGLVAPRLDPPLRLRRPTPSGEISRGFSGLVMPIISEFNGVHGFPPPGLSLEEFDVGQYMEHMIGLYFRSRGAVIRYDRCMETMSDCEDIPAPP